MASTTTGDPTGADRGSGAAGTSDRTGAAGTSDRTGPGEPKRRPRPRAAASFGVAVVAVAVVVVAIVAGRGMIARRSIEREHAEYAESVRRHRAQWDAGHPSDYRFVYRASCGNCPGSERGPFLVTVSAAGTGVRPAEPGGDQADQYLRLEGMESVFERAARGATADSASVTYDERYGFPARISIDGERLLADDEVSISIEDFEPR